MSVRCHRTALELASSSRAAAAIFRRSSTRSTEGRLAATIAVVISNRADAGGLERARAAGIETLVVDHRAFADPRRLRSGARRASWSRAASRSSVSRASCGSSARRCSRRFPNAHPQRPPVAPAGVSGRRCPAPGARARRQGRRRDRAPRHRGARRRSHRAAGRRAGARRRHGGDARRPHPDRRAPDLSRGRQNHARRRLERRRPPVPPPA